MLIKKLRPSFTFTEDRLRELQALAPEAFADGKINWETLREALGDYFEEEGSQAEHFGLFWPGKREARRLAAMPSKGTLIPCPGEGVNEDMTRNIFIEGDNLEVLKLMQKSYAGRVKMIYIDPPYNTGNDFVYKDDFRDPLEDYLRKTAQADEEGQALTTNPKASGRFHSNWLTMMYPHLRLARTLLREDGVIFVSIDDNEVHNLKIIMTEVFGEENFVGQIVVQLNPRGRHLDKFLAKTHEYVVVYARDGAQQPLLELEKDERMAKEYSKKDARGSYRELELRNRNPAFNSRTRPNLYYPIYVNPGTGGVSLSKDSKHTVEVYPRNSAGQDSCWTWNPEKFKKDQALLLARRTSEGDWRIFRKDYFVRDDGTTATTLPKALWLDKEFNNDYGKKAIQELFSGKTVFDFPKSPAFIRRIIEIGMEGNPNDTVLDFFAGSCTTAQSLLEFARNKHGGNFILVQYPEPTPNDSIARKEGYETLSDLGKERIRRVIKKMGAELKGKLNLGHLTDALGFKVFRLALSNYRGWQDFTSDDIKQLEMMFEQADAPLVNGWKHEDMLTETLLLEGFPLDSTVTPQTEFKRNKVLLVESDACAHRLFVCLDEKIKDDTIERLKPSPEDVIACLDSALTDETKLRLADTVNLRVI